MLESDPTFNMEKKKLLLYVCDIKYSTNNQVNKIKCICYGGVDQI